MRVRKKVIFLTGGTGFVGSYMAHRLLKEGYEIKFLARSSKGQSAEKRIKKSLRFIDSSYDFSNQYEVIEGDITKPNLGIDPFKIQRLKNCIDEVWHCAASISFRAEEKDKTYKINVEGTRNVLEFATKMQIPRLHYFSTAYVSGNRLGRVYEDELDCGQKFRNTYERTKFEAEKLVRDWKRRNRLGISIYRPSIVVGNSQDGRAPTFAGYYTVARSFYLLRKMVLKRLDKYKYTQAGVFTKNGFLNLLVRIPCFPKGTVNIVTIDYLTDVIYDLASTLESVDKTFHIVNQNPPTFEWLFNTSLSILGIEGFRLVNIRNSIRKSMNVYDFLSGVSTNELLAELELEILLNCGVYFPYISGEPVFDDSNVRKLLGRTASHPPVTKKLIEKLLRYAMDTEFGKCPIQEGEVSSRVYVSEPVALKAKTTMRVKE